MGELKIDRTYHGALRRLGVKDPGEVGVSVPVQLTAVVDDLSHLVPPIEVSVEGIGHFQGAQAVRFTIPVELEVRASAGIRGVWLVFVNTALADIHIPIRETTMITDDLAVLAPAFCVSPIVPNSALVWRAGTTTINPNFFSQGLSLDVGGAFSTPIFVPPPAFITLVGTDPNAAHRGSMVVQIVPGV